HELLDRSDPFHPPQDLLGQRAETPLQIPQEDSAGLGESVLLPLLAPLLAPLFYPFLLPLIGPTIATFCKHPLDLLKVEKLGKPGPTEPGRQQASQHPQAERPPQLTCLERRWHSYRERRRCPQGGQGPKGPKGHKGHQGRKSSSLRSLQSFGSFSSFRSLFFEGLIVDPQ